MKSTPSRNTSLPPWIVIVGWSQIIGGALACAAQFFVRSSGGSGIEVAASIPLLLVGAASIVAGTLLLSKHRFGVKASLGIQLLQVFAISGQGHWVFAAGGALRFLVASHGIGVQLGIGGQFHASLASYPGVLDASGYFLGGYFRLGAPLESAQWVVGINFIALYFARRLWRLLRGIEERAKHRERAIEKQSAAVIRAREMTEPQFDEDAKRIHERALDEAELLQHQYIGPEHLLLAILRDDVNDGVRAIKASGADVSWLMQDVTDALPPGKPKFNPHRLYPHTSRAAQILRFAVESAASQGLATASPGHLVLAMLREGNNIAARTLVRHGVNEAALRSALASVPNSTTTPPSPSEH